MKIDALAMACSVAGSQSALARAIGVTPPLLSQWKSGVRPIPIERCVAIERATSGAVMRWHLRPDDWPDIWPELTSRTDAPAPPASTSPIHVIGAVGKVA